jgi:hypothetical protein
MQYHELKLTRVEHSLPSPPKPASAKPAPAELVPKMLSTEAQSFAASIKTRPLAAKTCRTSKRMPCATALFLMKHSVSKHKLLFSCSSCDIS